MTRSSRFALDLRVVDADDWKAWRGVRLAALAQAPYAFGSKLADWQGTGDTEPRWRARLSEVPFNVVAFVDGAAAGIVSGTECDEAGTAELISMWVAPFARGRGVGDSLVAAVIDWARAKGAARIALDVVPTNEHAIALYRRHGFADAGAVDGSGTDAASERRMVREL